MTAGVSRKKRWLKVLGFGFLGIAFIALVLPVWRSWLAHAQLADGRVEFGSNQVIVSAVEWHRGKLTATVRSSRPMETFVIGGDFSGAPPYAMVLQGKSSGLASRIQLSRTTDQWQAAGEANWESNRVVWDAVFGQDGWLPRRGSLKSDHFRVPA